MIELFPGLYERVLDEKLTRAMEQRSTDLHASLEYLDSEDSFSVLAEHMKQLLTSALAQVPSQNRLNIQAEVCNALVRELTTHVPNLDPAFLEQPLKRLLALETASAPQTLPPRPDTPLSEPCLLTGTRHDPSLASQLKKELASADRVDILCSFVKWTGLRLIAEELERFAASGRPLRVLTTTYTGATDTKAVAFLKNLPHAQVQVSYDGRRTRLHAKAYLFHRDTGFSTAYVGSANLSGAALTEGLEWNVKVSRYRSPELWEKLTATFGSYWNDGEFVPCRAAEDLKIFEEALKRERRPSRQTPVLFNLRPYPFQQEILDRLQAERKLKGRTKNLVVAATGTGKTMIAAFDYRSFADSLDRRERPRLLYIAHRREILEQALETFRAVLRDHNFGCLLADGSDPASMDHLFCTIQSFNARNLSCRLCPDHFDYLVVDESHHAPAHSYQELLHWAEPLLTLGLTATPERMDDRDILAYFDDHISAEIRLPEAIERGFLCPFHYFGVTDTVNFSKVKWARGGYDAGELDNILTGNTVRLRLVLDQLLARTTDPKRCRGLGFCTSIDHADFMADGFNRAGLPSLALSSHSSREVRDQARDKLDRREINFIFTVDLYNEGVDLPRVDTVLFLRPTQSLTVFLQQLGRGLRLADGKECLTVLDFVGQAHRKFRFDRRFRELLPDRALPIGKQVEEGFPYLPSGCSIQLERVARDHVLANIRQALGGNRKNLIRDLKDFINTLGRDPGLKEFLDYFDMETGDLYRKSGGTYQTLSELLSVSKCMGDLDGEKKDLYRGLAKLSSADSPRFLRTLERGLSEPARLIANLNDEECRLLQMAHVKLVGPERKSPADTLA